MNIHTQLTRALAYLLLVLLFMVSLTPNAEAALVGPTEHMQFYNYTGVNSVERYLDCPPDRLLSGIAGRVFRDNLKDLTIYCRTINADGSLSTFEQPQWFEQNNEEQNVHSANNQAIIGAGVVVSKDNVRRLVINICPWIPSQLRVDINNCTLKSSDGITQTEKFVNVHTGLSQNDARRTVATGFGFTSTGDNTFGIRMSFGSLK